MKNNITKAKWIEYNPMPYAVEPVYKNNATVFYKDFNLSELPKNATINI